MTLEVRNYRPRDRRRCVEIFAAGWAHAFPHIPRAIDTAAFLAETRDERILVAVDHGALLGFAGIYPPDDFLHHLYVDPPYHGRGVGRALIEGAHDIVAGRLNLKCSISNSNARAFYARLGFSEADYGEDQYGKWVRLRAPLSDRG
ncbi:MAG TPA: GNAT family N-acetyltransferase [Caulobacterales bacterium]|nr:GNAT family N-acetyltransferase [Caulobacterales bacterium]